MKYRQSASTGARGTELHPFFFENFLFTYLFWIKFHLPWYCTVHGYVVIHFVIVCGLFEWQRICAVFFFYRLLIYVLPFEIQLSRGGEVVRDPI